MKPNSIRTAFDHVNVEPSPSFRDNLRAQFVAEMTRTEHDKTIRSETSHKIAGNNSEDGATVTVIDAPPANIKHRRPNIIIGVAAAIIVVAVFIAAVLTRRSEPTGVSDTAIAESALMTTRQLGGSFTVKPAGPGSTRDMGVIAARIPACAPYVDYAFDSPGRNAVTTERDFQGEPPPPLVQLVYLFPTEGAATEAMSKMAEDAFVPCFNAFIEALIAATSGGLKADVTTVEAPPFATHGDRQVVIPQSVAYLGGGVFGGTFTLISFFVQVGRGIVYVDPILRQSDPLDTTGNVEKVVAAATDALSAALDR